jgi:hypothetical protein
MFDAVISSGLIILEWSIPPLPTLISQDKKINSISILLAIYRVVYVVPSSILIIKYKYCREKFK